ncbi:MAG: PKD domain-containing protein [Euryarchaeota archaeon]|nr:PKD domain-containing protein [Euryarchaeota archaeon]MDE1837689.1 PKD domain-containing protein [Euryarchaeota archaeon]MDE1881793.1 PKD domain-containing protein [Euryarchaeota archaeon]MDE2045981.1 PKD domain-containing protein [Thermoplasmata archaeon]
MRTSANDPGRSSSVWPATTSAVTAMVMVIVLVSPFGNAGAGANARPRVVEEPRSVPVSDSRASAVPSQSSPDWINITGQSAGPAPVGGLFAYDAADGYDLQFGGCLPGGNPTYPVCPNDTYTYSGLNWTNITSTAGVAPPAIVRGSANSTTVMAYDPVDRYVLLFEGALQHNWTHRLIPYAQTWEFHGGRWRNLSIAAWNQPPPQQAGALAYDAFDGYMVFFGGWSNWPARIPANSTAGNSNFTWIFRDGSWADATEVPPYTQAPPPDINPSMAFDPTLNALVMQDDNETWKFVGEHWYQLHPTTTYAKAYGSAIGWDPQMGRLMLWGGAAGPDFTTALWELTNGNWTPLATAHEAPAAFAPSFAWDPIQRLMLLWGGATNLTRNDWMWVLALPLQIQATSSATSGPAPLILAFTSNTTGGVTPSRWSWHFGDGGSSTNENATHAFLYPGNYNTWVNVSDRLGILAQSNLLVIAVDPGLTVSFSASPATGIAPLSVSFQAYGQGGGQAYTASWHFGDGGSSLSGNTSHVYVRPGTYSATAWVNVSVASYYRSFLMAVSPSMPFMATAGADPDAGAPPLMVGFNGTATGGNPPFSFAWRFGDGGSSIVRNPIHSFTRAGSYSASLWVNDSRGRVATSSVSITVAEPSPPLVLGLPPAIVCAVFVASAFAVVVLLAVFVARRRRGRRAGSESEDEYRPDERAKA